MPIKYLCDNCGAKHRRGALIRIHNVLVCRKCLKASDEVMPGKYKKHPTERPKTRIKAIGAKR